MSTITADVVPIFQFVFDTKRQFLTTKDRLNLLAKSAVTVPLTNKIKEEDLQTDSVTTPKIKDDAVTPAKINAIATYTSTPIVQAVANLVASVAIADGAQIIAAQPDVPRNIEVALTDGDSSITAGNIVLVGTDAAGASVTETHVIASGSGTQTFVGTKIYGSLTSVTVDSIAGNTGADLLEVGSGKVIGVPNNIVAAGAVKHVYFNNVREASPTVTAGVQLSGVDVSASTYDGAKRLVIFYNLGG